MIHGGQLSVEILHLSTEAKSYDSHPLHENYVNIYGGWPDTICQSIALLGSIGLAWWDRVITCLRLIDHLHSRCRASVDFLEVICERWIPSKLLFQRFWPSFLKLSQLTCPRLYPKIKFFTKGRAIFLLKWIKKESSRIPSQNGSTIGSLLLVQLCHWEQ